MSAAAEKRGGLRDRNSFTSTAIRWLAGPLGLGKPCPRKYGAYPVTITQSRHGRPGNHATAGSPGNITGGVYPLADSRSFAGNACSTCPRCLARCSRKGVTSATRRRGRRLSRCAWTPRINPAPSGARLQPARGRCPAADPKPFLLRRPQEFSSTQATRLAPYPGDRIDENGSKRGTSASPELRPDSFLANAKLHHGIAHAEFPFLSFRVLVESC